MNNLFEIIQTIFTNPLKYSSISNGDKRKYYFLLQRRFAVQYPMQANLLQHIKINQSAVIDFWQAFLRKQYRQTPGWIYVKGVKKTQENKEKKINVSNNLINEYCKYYNVDRKSVDDALRFYENEMIIELKHFENILKQK